MNKVTIKLRLIITLSSFILLILVMGGMLITFSIQDKNFSRDSLQNYTRLLNYQEISQDYNVQWQNLDNYVKSGRADYLNKFNVSDLLINRKIYKIEGKADLDEWYSKYGKLVQLVSENSKLPIGEFRNLLSKRIIILNGDLQFSMEQLIERRVNTIKDLEQKITGINRLSVISSVVIGLLAISLSVLMCLLVFRSIILPLGIFQKGTRMIGEGNLEYQIKIDSKDELGQLADSFNSMIENLRNLQLQVIQMDRMSSIGQLAGGVAHEINNPLTGVLGQSQLLLEKLPPESPFRRNVERIEIAAQRCRTIVRALLDFAREKNYNFQPTDINDLINDTFEFSRSEMNSKKILLERDIPDPMPYVQVSSGHIQQVFLNIVNNAIHAMPNGGKLYITASMVERNILEIAFTDTGMGIKKENIGHVFDPFFTTKEVGKGTGLGLTISYGIIKRHNGEILVKSDGENKGASFLIRLPISHEQRDEKEHVTQLFSPPLSEKEPVPVKTNPTKS